MKVGNEVGDALRVLAQQVGHLARAQGLTRRRREPQQLAVRRADDGRLHVDADGEQLREVVAQQQGLGGRDGEERRRCSGTTAEICAGLKLANEVPQQQWRGSSCGIAHHLEEPRVDKVSAKGVEECPRGGMRPLRGSDRLQRIVLALEDVRSMLGPLRQRWQV